MPPDANILREFLEWQIKVSQVGGESISALATKPFDSFCDEVSSIIEETAKAVDTRCKELQSSLFQILRDVLISSLRDSSSEEWKAFRENLNDYQQIEEYYLKLINDILNRIEPQSEVRESLLLRCICLLSQGWKSVFVSFCFEIEKKITQIKRVGDACDSSIQQLNDSINRLPGCCCCSCQIH